MAEEIKFKKGERLTADKMNKLAKLAKSYGTTPGSFVGGGVSVQRPVEGGGITDHFQIIRGVTVSAVTPAMAAFAITTVSAFEEFAKVPGDSIVMVAAPSGGVTLAAGATVWAIYKADVYTIPAVVSPPSPAIPVHWLLFTVPASGGPNLRRFIYTAHKETTDSTATVKWLSHSGVAVGSDVTVHDPKNQFYGRVQGYLLTGLEDFIPERAFQGLAIERTDLAEVTPGSPRWDIIASEEFKPWIKARLRKVSNYPSLGSHVEAIWIHEDEASPEWGWGFRHPALLSGEVGYKEDFQIFNPTIAEPAPSTPGAYTDGPYVIMDLCDVDEVPPRYRVRNGGGEAGTAGGVRFCQLVGTISAATMVGAAVSPNTTSRPQLFRNATTGLLEGTGGTISFDWVHFDPIEIPSGRMKVGVLHQDAVDPARWVLEPPGCLTAPLPD